MKNAAALLEEEDVLGAARSERLYEPAALGEFLRERLRHARVRRSDEDRIEGRLLRQPLAPVADDDHDVVAAGERRACGLGEVGKPFDAEHFAREPRQECRLPAVAGADLE